MLCVSIFYVFTFMGKGYFYHYKNNLDKSLRVTNKIHHSVIRSTVKVYIVVAPTRKYGKC